MASSNWQYRAADAEGIARLELDAVDGPTNVLNEAVISELEALLDQVNADAPTGLIISSAKSGFIAGADVKAFTRIGDPEQALALIRRGQELMDRIEALPCATLALINGHCLGGGLELALACDYRIALDAPQTRIGLPEVKLGIHPGFGGTVRSIRACGPLAAMDLMLSGRTVDARTAQRMGLVHHAVPQRQLENAARRLLGERPSRRRPRLLARLAGLGPMRALIARRMRAQVRSKARPEHYPAPYALIDLWVRHGDDETRMYLEEAKSVARLITGASAQNLVRVFLLQSRLKSMGDKRAFEPRHVHVVGGGVMGGDIAAWCALQGLRVTVQDANPEALAATLKRAHGLYARRFRRTPQEATATLDRLIPDPRGEGLHRADVVIEAIFEDIDAKQALFRDIEPRLKPGCLVASNTSSIPLERLAGALQDPSRLVGLHFFNPVAKMPLLEIVRGAQTSDEALARGVAFARHIDKLPLPVKSAPGFLVNRILMPYLLEAVLLEQEGVPITAIDEAARAFGMPMGPVELADTVGLDVALHVGQIVGGELGFEVPERLSERVEAGRLGRKSGRGFYEWRGERKSAPKPKTQWTGDLEAVRERLILRLANEGIACLREGIVSDADLVDAGVIFGTGFAPYTGGPLHYVEAAGRQRLHDRLGAMQDTYGARFRPDAGWTSETGA
jgi:3-hydroxyacyl-CoA dehydrogenase/enoyl-CoA hydratase/3-hydroxybutyryl-CoA epimerase